MSFKNERAFRTTLIKRIDRTSLRQYYQLVKYNNTWLLPMRYLHALKSTETISKAVQCLPNHLRHSFYKYTQIHVDPNKSLSLLQFEKWLVITVRQYINPIANIVASQKRYKYKQRTSQEFTRNNHLQSDNSNNITTECWLCSEAHKLPSLPKFQSKSLLDKKKVADTYKLCLNCLAKENCIKQCQSKVT